MAFQTIPIHELKPYENNPREHPIRQLQAITDSIKRFGFKGSILIDRNNVIVAGHARYEAAAAAGLSEITCEYADGLTDDEIIAYRILDNKIAEMGYDNIEKLDLEIKKIPDFNFAEFSIEIPTFEKINEGLCDENDIPGLVSEPITKLGDIWLLGNHRLMCGDSTMIDDVEKLMNGEKADMVFTDPPYGIDEETDRDFASRTRKCKGNKFDKIIGDKSIQTAIDSFNLCTSLQIPTMVFWGANYYCHSIPESGNWLVWDKRIEENQRDMNSDCELAWVKSKANSVRIFRHLWKGMIKGSENGQARCHPTQKPIALAEWCFNEYGKDAKTILDLFGGSGSTLIACEKTNRKCFMMELSPQYCDVIIKRWEKFTGQDAILESTQQTYKELSNECR